MMQETTEAAVLQALLPQLEEEGYAVYLHPNRLLLPPFLKDYVPDLIALRPDKNLAIEVAIRETPKNKERLQRIASMFEGQDKWELRVYWGTPDRTPENARGPGTRGDQSTYYRAERARRQGAS